MKTWADYLITAVRYEKSAKEIDQVLVVPFALLSRSSPVPISRHSLLSTLYSGVSVGTAVLKDEEWYKGHPVSIVKIEGVNYVKTAPERTSRDFLANLPGF